VTIPAPRIQFSKGKSPRSQQERFRNALIVSDKETDLTAHCSGSFSAESEMLASEQSHDTSDMLTITLISFRKDPAQVVRPVSDCACSDTIPYGETTSFCRPHPPDARRVKCLAGIVDVHKMPASGHTDKLRVPFLSAESPSGMRTALGLLTSCPGQRNTAKGVS